VDGHRWCVVSSNVRRMPQYLCTIVICTEVILDFFLCFNSALRFSLCRVTLEMCSSLLLHMAIQKKGRQDSYIGVLIIQDHFVNPENDLSAAGALLPSNMSRALLSTIPTRFHQWSKRLTFIIKSSARLLLIRETERQLTQDKRPPELTA